METGHMALACVANAFYNVRDYARERVQGRPFTNPKGERVTIINHEDIRRTLLMGKAYTEAFRAMLMKALFHLTSARMILIPLNGRKLSIMWM